MIVTIRVRFCEDNLKALLWNIVLLYIFVIKVVIFIITYMCVYLMYSASMFKQL